MVKPGYKQTEVGLIPEEWNIKPLKEVAPLQRGFDLPYSSIKEGRYPVVFSNGIGAFHSSYMVKGPGVVTGRSGTIGKIHYVEDDYWPHNTALWVTDFHDNDPLFIFFLFRTIPWNLYNSGSGVPTLNRNDVHDYLVSVPTKKEQINIAILLADSDNLIDSLEKQLAKKKAIKQGAMQELLTGKRRLPGFSGEWKEYHLSEICQLINGRAYSQDELLSSGKYRVLRLGNLFTNGHWYYSDLELSEKQYCAKGDLIYAWSATFGPHIWQGEKVIYHYHIWKVRLNALACREYVYHYLSADVQTLMAELQGGTMAHLTKETMEKRMITIPEYDEQIAIAEILTTMDSEIEALEKKLTKYRQIKQGMMQQLLTGKIRLV